MRAARAWLAADDRVFSLGLFFVALAPRLAVAFSSDGPVWDAVYYHLGAARLAAGHGYSEEVWVDGAAVTRPWSHYPVGLPALLALAYSVFGASPRVGVVTLSVAGALLGPATHRLARRSLPAGRARAAGALLALSPAMILYGGVLMSEPLAALGVVVAAWAALRGELRLPWIALAGAVLGLATLVRPPSLVFAPALGLAALPGAGPLAPRIGRGLSIAALATATALAVVAPWTARNCLVLDGCALVSTNAGWNLAIGALPRSPGHFEPLRPSDGCEGARAEVEQDRCWARQGVHWIAEDPARWLRLAPRKLSLTFDHESFPLAYLAESRPGRLSDRAYRAARYALALFFRMLVVAAALAFVPRPRLQDAGEAPRRFVASVAPVLAVTGIIALGFALKTYWFWPLVPLAALAAFAAPRPGPVPYLSGFALLSVCVTAIVFFGEDRYHLVASPFLAILAAGALRDRDAPPVNLRRAGQTDEGERTFGTC